MVRLVICASTGLGLDRFTSFRFNAGLGFCLRLAACIDETGLGLSLVLMTQAG